jgi:phage terminase large subunit-like protein
LPETKRQALVASFNRRGLNRFGDDFSLLSHDHQFPPDGDWTTWLLLGGRGAGKTRAGAEWVRGLAMGKSPYADRPVSPIALVGETEHDAREVMIEGVAGLMAVHKRDERPVWISSRRRIEWPSGAFAQIFSAEDPDSLRGPQFAAAWCDDVVMDKIFTDSAKGIGLPNEGYVIAGMPASGTRLIYGLLEVRAAYTPANAEVFTIALEIDQD